MSHPILPNSNALLPTAPDYGTGQGLRAQLEKALAEQREKSKAGVLPVNDQLHALLTAALARSALHVSGE